jgi:beta-N-acetylhexosaminidase
MKLEEIIGQLFILGFKGKSIDEKTPIAADIKHRNLGGVILFDRLLASQENQNNIESPAQVKILCKSLQNSSATPLLIAIDQEGGMVKRLKNATGFPETESAGELGSHDDPIRTAIHAAVTAETLKKLGINLNLAPVVDLNIFPNNPVIGKINRSFSADPDCVIRHAATWMKEHKKQNILNCLKHFPGHGSSQTDSHLGFTDISKSWQEKELLPFQKLITQDNNIPVDCVMLGHLYHGSLDPQYPTSLSKRVVGSLLREQLGFQGVIITDDLQMKAITDKYGIEESVCLALAAGVDMIIVGNNLEYDPGFLKRIIPEVIRAVKEKRISENHIRAAWQRICHMKAQLAIKS